MIGQTITSDKDGAPLDDNGVKLSKSAYQPTKPVMDLFARVQRDYQVAYTLQHRTWDEFDGVSLLTRARLDQQTFGAYVGAEYVPAHKQWRWRGRKNTARNKIMGILAHMLAGMLYPYVYAKNELDEDDKMTARVMRILIEDHLKKAKYEIRFLYMILSALANPAAIVEVEYVEAIQKIKSRLADGTIQVIEAVDEILSGLNMHIIPIDEFLIADFFTGELQKQPYLIRVRRIPYDYARATYADRFYEEDGTDRFDYVEAGKTRVFLTGQENQTLYDITWTEADRDYVQEITAYYRNEDLQVTFVAGVFMGEVGTKPEDIYNENPFLHRRFTMIRDKWFSIPVYPFAKTGYEPIDPTGRFFYYKSAAFKEYWDDAALTNMARLVHDGTYLDVIKPVFMSGVAKIDSTVMVPGATIGMPSGASVTPYSAGSNLAAAYNLIAKNEQDMADSTVDKIMTGGADKGVTAYATSKAEQNARITLGNFGIMIADLITQVGELVKDCIVMHTTVGELDASVPEALQMKFKTYLAHGKEKGKNITNRIIFTYKHANKKYTEKELENEEWKLWHQAGGNGSEQEIYEVNPYQFARTTYTLFVDADKITMKSAGLDQQRKLMAFNIMTDPRVAPFTDRKAVVDDFAIEEYGGDDPDRYKVKGDAMMSAFNQNPNDPNQPNNGQNPGGTVPSNDQMMSPVGQMK